MKKRSLKQRIVAATLALVMLLSSLLGTTFAWFTDSVTSGGNKIQSGNLEIDLLHKVNSGWVSLKEHTDHKVFDYDKWEPGYTRVESLKVANLGSLALKYKLSLEAAVGTATVGKNGEKLSDVIDVYILGEDSNGTSFETIKNSWVYKGTLTQVLKNPANFFSGELLPTGEDSSTVAVGSKVISIALHMQEEAGNEYQKLSVGDIYVNLIATQSSYENDSFDDKYDEDAIFPELNVGGLSIPVNTANGATTEQTESSGKGVSATIPKGVAIEDGVDKLVLSVSEKEQSDANLTLNDGEALRSLDVHMTGVSENNTVPMLITVEKAMKVGLNIGNYKLFHVEGGVSNQMTAVNSLSELDAHNEFYYDPVTGDVTLAMATFSEVALVAEQPKWEGNRDYTWYNETDTEFTIANADQLAAFGAIVGGMAKDENGNFLITYTDSDGDEHHNDSFEGKTVKLLADINLGDAEAENDPDLIFYPIGYWNSEGIYEKTGTAISSGFYAFEGTFDGNGNTISNFYQNTWEMKGDHDWYDATLQYYRDGMGLFGKVYGGTVKNLTVDNFSCDSEIGTSGVIAAYADSKAGQHATFENITITNCNPRVYNIGNGGIVGCAGWYSRNDTLRTGTDENPTYDNAVTFRNITVDQTNKISALWGSWGVSCAGILGQYYPNSSCGIKLENCHVAAIIDVNNDVCSNYQYYWYRYAGMFIGTIRANTTDANGYTVADTTGVTATDCTYTMGNWNEYWYCEIVANSLASYTHDHQFSRLENIYNISEISDDNGVTWKKEGHFALLDENRDIVDCYHIFKNSNGELYQHFHDKADESNPNIYESFDLNGDGELNDLKEDRQRYFIPFNQLLTGLDMGIKAHTEFEGIEFVEDGTVKSVQKFNTRENNGIDKDAIVSIGDLFEASGNGTISSPTVQVYVSPIGYGSTVSATYSGDAVDWQNGTLTFSGTGSAKVVITDHFYCTKTTLYVTVGGVVTAYDKFETKFTGDFLYRVGNQNTVTLDSLFKAKDDVTIGSSVSIAFEDISGNGVSGTYTPNSTWTNGTIQFSGTGVVKVTITDGNYCTPTELYLEVVDAVNATTATDATSNNVVLLSDISGGFTVSGRYTVFGNGFTLNYTGNGQYLNNGLKQGVVTVSENGTLDNLRIKATIYPVAYMYYGDAVIGDAVKDGPSSTEGDKIRYHYQLSAVAASGNATISNCYIYGGRNNIFVNTGDVTIKDTILECGVVANIQIQSNASHTITLENVTTIQYQVNATIVDTSKVMLGAGILVGPETTDNPKIVLNGSFKQYNWVNTDDANAVSGQVAQMIINGALDATDYNHIINGKTASNLGIIYMNEYAATVTNNTGLPYVLGGVSMSYGSASVKGQAYSLQGANESQIYSDYENADRSTENDWYQPQFKYPADLGGQYIENTDGCDEFLYREGDTIKVLFPSGDTKELNLADLVNIIKYTGQDLGLVITCKDENGNAVAVTDGKITLSNAGEYTVTYTVTDTLFYDKDGNKVSQTIEYSWDITISVSLKDTAIPDAYFEFDSTKQKMGYYVQSSLFSTSVYQYIPFLAGLNIYDYNGQTAYLRFNGNDDFSKVASIEVTNKYSGNDALIVVKLTDGGIITLQLLARADSGGGSTYTGSIKTSGNTIYFVNDGTTSDKEATTTAAYWYVDYYKFTGNNGVEITSAQQTFNSTGSSASTPSGSFSTTIKYTVTYDANNGNCSQTTGYATSASAAVTLPTPTRSDYIFSGWYTAASGGTRVGGAGESYTPTANITLYAQWGKPCTVTYNANGGTCDKTSDKYSGTALTLPTPTLDGYWFIGWYDAAEGGNKIGDAGATYNPSGEITLYAHWKEAVEYTVTYNANGGECDTASAIYQGTDLTLPTPTRTGYRFLGWFDAAEGGNKIGDAGASYTPSANSTFYAQWEQISYTITISKQENATVTVDKPTAHYNDTISVTVSFTQSNNKTLTVKDASGNTVLEKNAAGTYTFTMPASNVTIEASSSGSCFTPDTLITLVDGTQKRVDELTLNDKILAWDFFTGNYVARDIAFLINHGEALYQVANLVFSDGTTLNIIAEHGVFDYDLNKYVYITVDNMQEYIGHRFVQYAADGTYNIVTLIEAYETEEYTSAWSITSADSSNAFASGLLTVAPPDDFYNWIEMGDKLMYDVEQFEKDIETYGLYTYDDFKDYITYEQFVNWNGAYLKIAVEKGYFTFDYILELIEIYKDGMI